MVSGVGAGGGSLEERGLGGGWVKLEEGLPSVICVVGHDDVAAEGRGVEADQARVVGVGFEAMESEEVEVQIPRDVAPGLAQVGRAEQTSVAADRAMVAGDGEEAAVGQELRGSDVGALGDELPGRAVVAGEVESVTGAGDGRLPVELRPRGDVDYQRRGLGEPGEAPVRWHPRRGQQPLPAP